ncbi:RNA-binding S4 domain-containing protein [Trichothermofontia sichuanensis B231]|uniref:RNA-binding S4 domain-containing protein n=1 Tax=Trichothermofontia sichuanensis TaxID=3045816 RepID=UPI002245D2A2|nr:RNA-binding S4 domain-containing protein [Trichothermofontia sichuanensis]UZQ54257.1 RNA-binding S4 domain-containing protein [Trichothermofontia sichuanensis B231]
MEPGNPKPIKLDQFLKWVGVAATGGQAKVMIQAGEVRVNGEVVTQRGRKLKPGDRVTVGGQSFTVDLLDSAS